GDDPGWNGFNVLHTAAARVGGLDLGFLPTKGGRDVAGILAGAEAGEIDVVWLQAADEIDTDKLAKPFVIYQGHHGDRGAAVADVVLPGAAYTEKSATYVNTEGRVQLARFASFPLGEAREDWKILRALSEKLGKTLPYNSLAEVRRRLIEVNPVFGEIDLQAPGDWGGFGDDTVALGDQPFESPVANFYKVDPITRASVTMAKCTDEILEAHDKERTGTDG
ncbi:MAG: molybdopterin-dependent oxidoreductase, partial [Rhodospirillaceae bacterium]|nr:molybdopterin-dependent oxidoreductase [Rhodospirillaceae bacterium]